MHYSNFSFIPFSAAISESVNSSDQFLSFNNNFMLESFETFLSKIAFDIKTGLQFLHSKKIDHRNLKPGYMLACNRHYCNISDPDELIKPMKIEPIVYCLTEKAVVTTKTNLTGILAVLFLTNQACLDDLLKVDV